MLFRIDIQDRARRFALDPRQDDGDAIKKLREALSIQLEVLEGLRHRVAAEEFVDESADILGDPAVFDNLDMEDEPPAVPPATRSNAAAAAFVSTAPFDILPPESRRLSIPSRWLSTGNVYRAIELKLRTSQADRTLQALRDTIAEKSFQYSHVIRVAPRKAVRTRARTAITKLNFLITYYSRVYAQCRAAMSRLGADNSTLEQYPILLKEDVKSSTALLDPNKPGSTRVKLSWIWQTLTEDHESLPDVLRECERNDDFYTIFF